MLEKKNLEKLKRKPLRRSERKKKGRKKFFVISLFLALLASGYFYLLKSPISAYKVVSVSELPLAEKVRGRADDILKTKYAGIFPFASILTPILSPFEKRLRASLIEVDTLHVSRNILKKEMRIEYTLRKPVLRLEGGSLLDENNMVYVDERSFTLPLLESEKPLSGDDLRKIVFLKETVEIAISNIEVVRVDSVRDVTFVLSNEVKTQFVFSLNQNEKVVWSKAVSAFFDKSGESKEASFLNRATSVDLRFGDKIYYRLAPDANVTGSSTAQATTTYEYER